MIDIHTHIIFDVDDGSDTLEESIAILKKARENGVTDIILTPHYIDEGRYDKEKIDRNFNILLKKVNEQDIDIKLYLGNEIAVYGNITRILEDKRVKCLANSKYILIEFPMGTDVDYVLDTIYEIKLKNLVPVIAHPERCECFVKHPELINNVVNEGALLQCNTGSLLGVYGLKAKKIVKKLLKDNLISFFATDTHNAKNRRYKELNKVEIKVEEMVGLYEKNKLFVYNARNILLNNDITKDNKEV